MGKVWYSLPMKVLAAFLGMISCAVCVVSLIAIVAMRDFGLYQQGSSGYYGSNACSRQVYNDMSEVVYTYYWTYEIYNNASKMAAISDDEEIKYQLQNAVQDMMQLETMYSAANTNFRFSIRNGEGTLGISTDQGETSGYSEPSVFYPINPITGEEECVFIEGSVVDPFTAVDKYTDQAQLYDMAYRWRYTVIIAAVVSGLSLIALSIYLICAAGRKRGTAELTLGGLHRVPFDLLSMMVIVTGLAIAGIFVICAEFFSSYAMKIACIGLMAAALYSLAIFYMMSFAVRCKTHVFWKGMLVYRVCHWLKTKCLNLYHSLPSIWKGLLVGCIACVLTLYVGTYCIYVESIALFWLFMGVLFVGLAGVIAAYQLQLRKLQEGIRQVASGDLDARVESRGMHGDMKEQAENLNHINEAVKTAVEKQLKSERLKTELITNVSHDIKTPLTSIVNYVDLLKKQQVQDETVKEYIEVLDRQSVRLKKLIEDLIEASKASTGNIAMNIVRLDTTELLKQVAGEYTDRLKGQNLELVLSLPNQEVPVLADGQLLWRVFDNLLSNACKYSHPGTRVYLDLQESSEQVMITFRNISHCPLHVSGEELMERFVRGDSSRHTEGSGLGLSIARSLTDLMNGHFAIMVDGDLFKAQITLPKAE